MLIDKDKTKNRNEYIKGKHMVDSTSKGTVFIPNLKISVPCHIDFNVARKSQA